MSANLEAALSYAQRGWLVFPLHGIVDGVCSCRKEDCKSPGKHPITRNGVSDASNKEAMIRLWFVEEHFNVAIATGEKSGITVLDVDFGEKGGDVTWAFLTKIHGEPETLMARTGGGGLHIIFKYNSSLETSSNTLGKGVDCRNDDGYIVAPPSTHKSGRSYEWLNESPLADLPKHLAHRPKKEEKKGKKKKREYSLKDVSHMLEFVPADDRDMWRNVGIILGREFERADEAWALYNEWAEKWDGQKDRNHENIMLEAFHELSAEEGGLSIGTIIKAALENGWAPKAGSIPVDNFLYYAPGNDFIYRPSREFWVAASVDASVAPVNFEGELVAASSFIKAKALITSMTNDPLLQTEVIKEYDCLDGNLIPSKGGSLYNAYSPPIVPIGDPEKATPWLNHVSKIFSRGNDAEQFLDYMAHRVQSPGIKPRFALVLVGNQGLGKDSAISFCGPAIGEWNIESVSPDDIESGFNEYCSKVLVVVSEAANSQEMSKWTFNEKMKVFIAGTPDNMRINPKYGKKFSCRMHCGVIITTNHITGIYIPPDDRRYDIIQCPSKEELGWDDAEKKSAYFKDLWGWYTGDGGASHIAAFLHERDISSWNPATAQRITEAHSEIVSGGQDADEWLQDAITKMGNPGVLSVNTIWGVVSADPNNDMKKKEFRARIGHIMPRMGYSRLVNKNLKDGRWPQGAGEATTIFYHPMRTSVEDAIAFAKTGKASKEPF